MRIDYRKIKTYAPFCGECGEQLSGNNSLARPYSCSCGEWESVSWENPFEYKLKINGEELRKNVERLFKKGES
jgi:hypothetical protein